VLDAIAGNDRARPVASVLTVDEDGAGRGFNEGQKGCHLGIQWQAKAFEGHIGVVNAVGFGFECLPGSDVVGQAEVDDGLDAEPGEGLDAGRVRLGAAIEAVADLAEVANAFAGRQAPLARGGHIAGYKEQHHA
jgi:hypothetical protein